MLPPGLGVELDCARLAAAGRVRLARSGAASPPPRCIAPSTAASAWSSSSATARPTPARAAPRCRRAGLDHRGVTGRCGSHQSVHDWLAWPCSSPASYSRRGAGRADLYRELSRQLQRALPGERGVLGALRRREGTLHVRVAHNPARAAQARAPGRRNRAQRLRAPRRRNPAARILVRPRRTQRRGRSTYRVRLGGRDREGRARAGHDRGPDLARRARPRQHAGRRDARHAQRRARRAVHAHRRGFAEHLRVCRRRSRAGRDGSRRRCDAAVSADERGFLAEPRRLCGARPRVSPRPDRAAPPRRDRDCRSCWNRSRA